MARDSTYAVTVGSRIRAIRLARKMKAAELGRASGVLPHTLWRYEMGRQVPGVDALRRIAQALDVSIDELAAPSEAA